MRPFVAPMAVLAWILGAQAGLAGQLVIVESTAPGLESGGILDTAQRLEIAAGARITVIAEDGTVRTLEGPFSGTLGGGGPASGDRGVVASLARLIAGKGAQSGTLGVMRGGPRADPPDPLVVDIFRSGTHCAAADKVVRLWRQNTRRAILLEMKTLPYGAKVRADWPVGASSIVWPGDLALKDGGEYLAKRAKGLTASRLILRLVPAGLPSQAHRIAWMADAGCARQARDLLAGLH